MVKVVTIEQMREIERATDAAGVSYAEMMDHAGHAVAEVTKILLGDSPSDKRIAVLVGPGNNGGDGLVAARILREDVGAEVGAYLVRPRNDDDQVFVAARDAGVFIANAEDDQRWRVLKNLVSNCDILIDALLGTGSRLPIEGELHKLIEQTKQAIVPENGGQGLIWATVPIATRKRRQTVVAVDCPSGLNCDTGEIDPAAIRADITVTFGAAKLGQLKFPGAEYVGELVVADIGSPDKLPELGKTKIELATGNSVGTLLPKRPMNSHKGTFGRVLVVGGSVNYTGAVALCGSAAYRVGAGLVAMAVPQAIYPILSAQVPEATWLLLPHEMGVINAGAVDVLLQEMGDVDAMLIGPGLGREDTTGEFVSNLLTGQRQSKRGSIGFPSRTAHTSESDPNRLRSKLVIDADGLNLLPKAAQWWESLPAETVLTPHPGEMARLVKLDTAEVNADRIEVARQSAEKWGVVVVLKGAFTVIASPDGRITLSPFATSALATAGTGDVLAGCIVGLMAQGATAFDAAVAGTYIHGLAGTLAGQVAGNRSVVAGDVLRELASALSTVDPAE